MDIDIKIAKDLNKSKSKNNDSNEFISNYIDSNNQIYEHKNDVLEENKDNFIINKDKESGNFQINNEIQSVILLKENKTLEKENDKILEQILIFQKELKQLEENYKIYGNNNISKKDELNIEIQKKKIELEDFNNKNNQMKKKIVQIKKQYEEYKKENELIIKEKEYLNEEEKNINNKIIEKNLLLKDLINKINLLKNSGENISIEEDNFLESQILNFRQENKDDPILKGDLEKLKKAFTNEAILSYQKPPLVGLNNIGATCYMNSTLQCLSQTIELTNFFLKKSNKEIIINNNIVLNEPNKEQLSPYYLELLQNLWDKNGPKSFSPTNFRSVVEKINPLFKEGQAGDLKDFIIFILEQLHKELKRNVNLQGNLNSNNKNETLNQYNQKNSLFFFFNEFQKNCSIISDIFFGINETINICTNCRTINNSKGANNPIYYNYGLFNCLIFPLEEVQNYILKNNNIQINNSRVSLDDCFNYNQKREYFSGENRNYCNICKRLSDSKYKSKIYISPNVLILILNRSRGNIYDIKLDFHQKIDITKYVVQKDKPQIIYTLYGVITLIGESGPNAYFVASCKSPIDQNWYRYNDSMVNSITDIQKEVIEFGTPYILFYRKN